MRSSSHFKVNSNIHEIYDKTFLKETIIDDEGSSNPMMVLVFLIQV